MGTLKQLLPLGDRPLIRICIENIIASGVKDIVVVLPGNGGKISDALSGLPVNITFNNNTESDMAASVSAGLLVAKASSSSIMVCLCDHPLITAGTFLTLITAHRQSPGKIVVPIFQGKKGHPSIFPRHTLKEISSGSTMRQIIQKDARRVSRIEVTDEGVVLDMDTLNDYAEMLRRFRND